jgi:DNA-3-methyladenine glycosylase I
MSAPAEGLLRGDDGQLRCAWQQNLPDYAHYHDHEWGRPVTDDVRLFEKLCLEGFQAGLSWLTILRKREHFRAAFAGFDPIRVAAFGADDIARLLADAGIVRHRGKIEATINNAARVLEVQAEFGRFADYIWGFVPPPDERPQQFDWGTLRQLGQTPTSRRLSKDLLRRGFKFVGPTTCYAFMQAMGLVNDHVEGCMQREAVQTLPRPTRP